MSNIAEKRSEAAKIANQARALLDGITNENRSEKEAEFNRMMADSDALVRDAEAIERSEARSREFEAIATSLPNETRSVSTSGDAEKRSAARADYLMGLKSGEELRAVGITFENATGGYTVADAPMANLVEILASTGPLLNANFVNLINSTSANPLPIPVVDDTAKEAQLTAEGADFDEEDVAFSQHELRGYKITTSVQVSDEFLRDSNIGPEAVIMQLLGKRLARKGNKLLTFGTGSNQPEGIVLGAGLGFTTALSTAVTADELGRIQTEIDPAYDSEAAYMMNRATLFGFRTERNSHGDYVWGTGPNGSIGVGDFLWGKQVVVNNNMANIAAGTTPILYGAYSNFTVRMVGGVAIRRLNELYANKGLVGFQAQTSLDCKVVDATSIKSIRVKAA